MDWSLSQRDLQWLHWEPKAAAEPEDPGCNGHLQSRTRRPRSFARSLERQRHWASSKRELAHPDERLQLSRWLDETEASARASLLSRPARGLEWKSYGSALRLLRATPGNAAPFLVNHSRDCLEQSSAFPECTGLGVPLPAGRSCRLVFEVTAADPKATFAQVGIARVGADEADGFQEAAESKLSVFTTLLDAVCWTSCGDIQATMPIEVSSPGDHFLCRRADAWWTGAPDWDLKAFTTRRALLEVDLARGSLSFRLDTWTKEPIHVNAPELLTESSRPWTPLVSLSRGHEARICDFHLVCSGV